MVAEQQRSNAVINFEMDPERGFLAVGAGRLPRGAQGTLIGVVAIYDAIGMWVKEKFQLEGEPFKESDKLCDIVARLRKDFHMEDIYAQVGGEDPLKGQYQ